MQFGHLVALAGIEEKQNGQSFTSGTGIGFSCCLFKLFITLIKMNMANATIVKLIILLINKP